MNEPLTFGPWLKQRRKTLDLTQQNLADLTHCSLVTIRKIEAGALTPSKQLAEALSMALKIDSSDQAAFITFARSRHERQAADSFTTRSASAARSVPAPDAPRVYRVPASPTAIIGREWEISAARDLLRREARLLTLSGPPGAGKTRLSLAIAEALQNDFAHGACFVPLAAVDEAALVVNALADALGVTEAANRSLAEVTHTYLSDKQVLLVLDNFEQVMAAAGEVAQVLQAAPQVKIIVSSRETLRLYGEHDFPVPPLTTPNLKAALSCEELKMYSALELFEQRARAVQPRFEIDEHNAATIARICARLDGLPLAIEMAAARIRWLSPEKLLDQLTQHLPSLQGAWRDRAPRQQTLRGAIDWSYHLLTPDEQRLFNLCGVFSGGFDVEALTAIAHIDQTEELLQSLVDKSLIKYAAGRYSLLEMMRDYARDQLSNAGQLDRVRADHARHFLAVAQIADRAWGGPQEQAQLDRLEIDHDNLRAALTWASEQIEPDMLWQLCARLGWYWNVRGHWNEGQRWVEIAQRKTAAPLSVDQQRWRAAMLIAAGVLAENYGRSTARAWYEESLQLYRDLNDELGIAEALSGLGRVAAAEGDFTAAYSHLSAAINHYRAGGEVRGLSAALNSLGYVAYARGFAAEAEALCAESLALRRAAGDQLGMAVTLNSLGAIAVEHGDYERARELYEESLAVRQAFGDKRGQGATLNNLGIIASNLGDYATARGYYAASLALRRELGDARGMVISLINLGNVDFQREDWAAARAYYAAALLQLETVKDLRLTAAAINCLGNVALIQGQAAEARGYYFDALKRRRELGDKRGWLHTLAGLGGWLGAIGRYERAVEIAGAVMTLSKTLEWPLDQPEQRLLDQAVTAAREQLDRATFDQAWTKGEKMSLEEAAEIMNDIC